MPQATKMIAATAPTTRGPKASLRPTTMKTNAGSATSRNARIAWNTQDHG